MKSNAATSNPTEPSPRREQAALDARYGEIGISAVAAALPYLTAVKVRSDVPAALDGKRLELLADLAA